MRPDTWFDDLPVLGKLPPVQAAARLRDVGEVDSAATLEAVGDIPTRGEPAYGGRRSWWPFQDKPWQHTAHAFGYLAPAPPGSEPLPIQHAGNIASDPALRNRSIKITLDRLRVAGYPGGGIHRVLFDFYAQNQVPGGVEHLHFNASARVNSGMTQALSHRLATAA
jgi:hypothetical protein